MTTLKSDFSSVHRLTLAEYRRRVYATNGWDPVYRWDGMSAAVELAGIAGPSREPASWTAGTASTAAGDTAVGLHKVRYRYLDSRSGFVSEPSLEVEVAVASGAEAVTFTVENASGGAVAAEIQLSTDAKVDRIVLEATVKDGAEFFKAAEVPNDGTDVTLDLSDAALEQLLTAWPGTGHEVPPQAKYMLSHRERLWFYGQVVHSTGNCDPTNASTDVGEGTTDPQWSEDALGAAVGQASVEWLFRVDGDATAYEVDYADNGNTKIVLKEVYGGSTDTDAGYILFARSNVIWVSNPGYPEGFTPLKFVQGPNGELAGDIVACVGFGPAMVVLTLSGTYRFSWDVGPVVDGQLIPVSTKYGALGPRVCVEVNSVLYTMDRLGWQSFGGVRVQHISRSVDDLLADIDFDQRDNFHACFFPKLRAIRWFYCVSGDTYPKNYVELDVDKKTWGTGTYEVGISESKLVPTATGPRVLYGDENGHTWFADTGTVDGGVAGYSHLTVSSGASTTSIPTTETAIPTTNVGLGGAMAYHRESGESRLIASNTGSTLTTAAFTTAPAEGDTILVGRIVAKLKTGALSAPGSGPREVSRPVYLWLLFEPNATARFFLVRFYHDGSSTAFSDWGDAGSRPDTNVVDGVTFPGKDSTLAASDWKVDASKGVVRIPCGEEYMRTLSAELELHDPDSEIELYGIEWETQDGEERLD